MSKKDVETLTLVQTTLVTYTQAFLVGAGYSSIYVSLMYYLLEYFKNHANLYFCLIMSSTSLATYIGSILVKKLKTSRRNFKVILLVASLLSCLGHLCYTIHSSVWFLMLGRIICGLGDTAPEIVRGTMGKILTDSQLQSFSSKYEVMYMSGFLIGPVLVALLFSYKTSFDGGLLVIDRYNGIAFIFFWMFVALCSLMICCVSNLNAFIEEEEEDSVEITSEEFTQLNEKLKRKSKYYDEYIQRHKQQQQNELGEETSQHVDSPKLAKFILFFFVFVNLFLSSTEMMIVMLSVGSLNLSIGIFCALIVGCLLIFIVVLTKLWRKLFNYESRRFSTVVACIITSIAANVFLILASQQSFGKTLRVVFVILTVLLNSLCSSTALNAAQNIVGVLIPPDGNIFERLITWWISVYQIFGVCGLLLAGLILKAVTTIYTVFAILQLLFLGLLFKEKNKFKTD